MRTTDTPVSVLVSVTFASGTTAPDESFTTPTTEAVSNCARAADAAASTSTTARHTRGGLADRIIDSPPKRRVVRTGTVMVATACNAVATRGPSATALKNLHPFVAVTLRPVRTLDGRGRACETVQQRLPESSWP